MVNVSISATSALQARLPEIEQLSMQLTARTEELSNVSFQLEEDKATASAAQVTSCIAPEQLFVCSAQSVVLASQSTHSTCRQHAINSLLHASVTAEASHQ